MERITQEEVAGVGRLALRDPAQALGFIRQNRDRFKGDLNLEAQYGALSIDIGTDLSDSVVVGDGIRWIEAVEQVLARDIPPDLLYNLGNGYYALDRIARHEPGFCFDPDNTPLLQAKCYYRKALKAESQLDRPLREQLRVSHGNCLARLGRSVEAIEVYDDVLGANPDHPMAQGNLGIELLRFAHIAQHTAFLSDALAMMEKALANDHLEEYGGLSARRDFENVKQKIQSMLPNRRSGGSQTTVAPPAGSKVLRAYVEFSSRYGLFLNFCLRCRRCRRYGKDNLGFSLITDIGDDVSFVLLSRVINQIKESYTFARFLLFQSQHPLTNTVAVDELTSFVDNLDYAVYGTRIASLKLAFESGYGILDKIAHFINRYLDLKIPSHRIAFAVDGPLWQPHKNEPLRSEMVSLGNWHLYALYDIARDLYVDPNQATEDGYFGYLRRIRNRLMHEYVIPHVEGTEWAAEPDGRECHVSYSKLFDQTIAVLRVVRAAVIYLIAFIDQEENRKSASNSGLLAPLLVTDYDARLFGTALG